MLTANGSEHDVDAVVCAAHSDQALRLLSDADAVEHAVLGNVPYARNRAYLQTDIGLLPRRRCAWSSWNALLTQDVLRDDPIGVSYWMKPLQCLPGTTPSIVRSEENKSELQSLMRISSAVLYFK